MSARAIVEVKNGPRKGHKAAIAAGGRLRVGRAERADMVFAHDAQMSALHCEIAWDGRALRLSDLGSIKGTKRNGEPVTEAEIEDGHLVGAGETVLGVHLEDGIAPRKRHRATHAQAAVRERALAELRRQEGPLYAVLDAACDARILELLPRAVEEYQSLYEGVQGEALAEVAPYLVRLVPGEKLIARLVMEGWGSGWGVYLTWAGAQKDLRRHLRRFLMVMDDETNRRMYFRFYDPTVLRKFWPTCSTLQKAELLGEIGGFLVEGEQGDLLRLGWGMTMLRIWMQQKDVLDALCDGKSEQPCPKYQGYFAVTNAATDAPAPGMKYKIFRGENRQLVGEGVTEEWGFTEVVKLDKPDSLRVEVFWDDNVVDAQGKQETRPRVSTATGNAKPVSDKSPIDTLEVGVKEVTANIILIQLTDVVRAGDMTALKAEIQAHANQFNTDVARAMLHVSVRFDVCAERERKDKKSYLPLDFPVYLVGEGGYAVGINSLVDLLDAHGVPASYHDQSMNGILRDSLKQDVNGATAPASLDPRFKIKSHAKFSIVNYQKRKDACGDGWKMCVSNTILHEVVHQGDLPGHDGDGDSPLPSKEDEQLMLYSPPTISGSSRLFPQPQRRLRFLLAIKNLAKMPGGTQPHVCAPP